MDYVDKLNEIIKKKNNGEITKEEADKMKLDLVENIEGDKEVIHDDNCDT